MFFLSLVHFCTYKEKFISLYCRLSSVLDLDALITQQALREAITDSEVATAKQRHQLILDYIQVRNKPESFLCIITQSPVKRREESSSFAFVRKWSKKKSLASVSIHSRHADYDLSSSDVSARKIKELLEDFNICCCLISLLKVKLYSRASSDSDLYFLKDYGMYLNLASVHQAVKIAKLRFFHVVAAMTTAACRGHEGFL